MWHRITDWVREKMEPVRERRESGGSGAGGGGAPEGVKRKQVESM